MANNPFDRTIINPREKPLSQDINQAQSQLDMTMREVLRRLLAQQTPWSFGGATHSNHGESPASGFLGGGLRVSPSSPTALTVRVPAGIGFFYNASDVPSSIDSIVGLDDLSAYKPVVLLSDVTLNVPTPPGANSRIDLIEVRTNRATNNPTSRLVLNTTTGAFDPTTVDKTLTHVLDGSTGYVVTPSDSTTAIGYKSGTAAVTPVAPAVTAGYTAIAYVWVVNGATTIDEAQLTDVRKVLAPGGAAVVGGRWLLQWTGGAPVAFEDLTALQQWPDVVAPPGLRVGLFPVTTARGMGKVFVVGGDIRGGSMVITGGPTASPGAAEFVSVFQVGGVFVTEAAFTDTLYTQLAGSYPAIDVGKYTKLLACSFESRHQAAGATSQTDTDLESLYIQMTGVVYY